VQAQVNIVKTDKNDDDAEDHNNFVTYYPSSCNITSFSTNIPPQK